MKLITFFRDNFGSNGSDEDSARAMKLALELHALGLGGTESESEEDEEDLAALAPPKKSQNTTEVITVPSSEHVAEIVGKQGTIFKHNPSFLTLSSYKIHFRL